MQICLNFKINISNSELLCFTSYNVRLKLLSYVAITKMSKNLIKIAKVNFAGTTHKKIFATATTTCKRSVKYLNMQPHTHTHTTTATRRTANIQSSTIFHCYFWITLTHTHPPTHTHLQSHALVHIHTNWATIERKGEAKTLVSDCVLRFQMNLIQCPFSHSYNGQRRTLLWHCPAFGFGCLQGETFYEVHSSISLGLGLSLSLQLWFFIADFRSFQCL